MLKIIFISWFVFLVFISCNNSDITEPYNYERDTPVWLKEKIDSLSVNQLYYGAKVYRYTWNRNYIYHITVPIWSCIYCELYDYYGNKIKFTDNEFSDFFNNKTDEILVWEWSSSGNSR
jgi:hypothetical protein